MVAVPAAAVLARAVLPAEGVFVAAVVPGDAVLACAVFAPEDSERLRRVGTDLASFCVDIQRVLDDFARRRMGLAGYDLPDPIAMAVALDPAVATEARELCVRRVDQLGAEVLPDPLFGAGLHRPELEHLEEAAAASDPVLPLLAMRTNLLARG